MLRTAPWRPQVAKQCGDTTACFKAEAEGMPEAEHSTVKLVAKVDVRRPATPPRRGKRAPVGPPGDWGPADWPPPLKQQYMALRVRAAAVDEKYHEQQGIKDCKVRSPSGSSSSSTTSSSSSSPLLARLVSPFDVVDAMVKGGGGSK